MILVTGGAGFIGSHLVDALIKEGHEVRILDKLVSQVHIHKPSYLNKDAELMIGDVGDKDLLKHALDGVDYIFHQAAAVGVGQSMYEISTYVQENIMATANLLDYLVNEEHDVKKLIVASSMSIYGEGAYRCDDCGPVYPPFRETSQLEKREWEMKCPNCSKFVHPIPIKEKEKPLNPNSIYAINKRDQEEMCLVIGRAYGLPTVALRYFNVYGTRQSLSNPYTGVCAIFSCRIKNNVPPIIYEDGNQTRDFIHVSDIVQANLLAMKKSSANYKSFNVGTGISTSVNEVSDILLEKYESSLKPIVCNKYRAGDVRHGYADISEIKKIGFEPKVKFRDGIEELVDWVNQQPQEQIKNFFDKAEKELNEKKLLR